VTHPFKNANFDRFSLIVPQPWKLANEVQLSLIENRQCAFYQTTDEPCVLPQNQNFYILCCLTYRRASNHRHFKFGMPIDHSKY